MAEAVCAAVFGIVIAFLLTFAFDRLIETPAWVRGGFLALAAVFCAVIPLSIRRWVWGNRRLEQLARLLARKHPSVGDQLLGIIELVHDDSEQARSLALCEAAVAQVAQDAQRRDFRDSVPNPRHKLWAWLAFVPTAAAVALLVAVPAAATNAWARFLAPWAGTPRYTFAALDPIPPRLIVAHGEPFVVSVQLADRTVWRPAKGRVQLAQQAPVVARLNGGRYEFELPSQINPGWLDVRIGDARHRVRIEPTMRPELTSVVASVALPKYLGRSAEVRKDVRGGAISLVKGSQANFAATASRELSEARVDGKPRAPEGKTVSSPTTLVDNSRKMEFRWQDKLGLAGKEPFTLSVNSRDDEAPSLSCEDLPKHKVVLDTEQLSFKIRATDDFGLRRVGVEWQGLDDPVVKTAAKGERILAPGSQDKESLEVAGTFSAKSLGIEPQPVQLRIFAEDYFPGRPRVYSSPYLFYVLTPEQHAIWLTEQLSKWHRQALEVRDKEMELHETNKQLRELTADQLDRLENRRKVEHQAAAERANGRRLNNLVANGEDLVRQAMRNPEFGVGHLERWAEMLQVLKDISGNRMPSVADLLKKTAQAPTLAANTKSNNAPRAGQVRASESGKPRESDPNGKKQSTAIPTVADRESSMLTPDKKEDEKELPKSKGSGPSLRLPVTTLGGGKSKPGNPPPATQTMEQAVAEQQDLLAEFEKIAAELNRVLANLEGSTLVKRLKAQSRHQYKIAGRINDNLGEAFGVPGYQLATKTLKTLGELGDLEAKGSHDVSLIMDDMQAYFERRRFVKFKAVLDDMRKQDVIGSLRSLGDDIKRENGMSIAQCEFWSDTLDRWAEDLVDPTMCGACPGGKTPASLPPSIVLEVLQILEGEVNLREDTRVTEQARAALAKKEYGQQAHKLSGTQNELDQRVVKVTQRIRELKNGEKEFAKEIALLGLVAKVMDEATGILDEPETGNRAIAAETEAIELLLQSRRINPRGGGGGGSTPGGGGTGKTVDSALALLGGGVNDKEQREDHGVSQTTGDAGPVLPEEFRSGLDEYFNRLERRTGGGQ
jgi:hypothetical protein